MRFYFFKVVFLTYDITIFWTMVLKVTYWGAWNRGTILKIVIKNSGPKNIDFWIPKFYLCLYLLLSLLEGTIFQLSFLGNCPISRPDLYIVQHRDTLLFEFHYILCVSTHVVYVIFLYLVGLESEKKCNYDSLTAFASSIFFSNRKQWSEEIFSKKM